MTFKYLMAALTVMLFCADIAAAQDNLDGQYSVTTGPYASLYSALPSGQIQHNAETVREVISHVMKDGLVNAQELDIYAELARTDVSHVTLNLNGKPYKVPVADSEGRELLALASELKVSLNALWDDGAQGRQKIYLYHSMSLTHKNHVQRFVASKLHPAWKLSNISNQYMPLRKAIGEIHRQNETELGDKHGYACDVLHGAAETLDQYLKDAVPDYVYSWIPSHIESNP